MAALAECLPNVQRCRVPTTTGMGPRNMPRCNSTSGCRRHRRRVAAVAAVDVYRRLFSPPLSLQSLSSRCATAVQVVAAVTVCCCCYCCRLLLSSPRLYGHCCRPLFFAGDAIAAAVIVCCCRCRRRCHLVSATAAGCPQSLPAIPPSAPPFVVETRRAYL